VTLVVESFGAPERARVACNAAGTKMAFPGFKKPEERAAVIAYLKTKQ
jgi:cytochrome c2